MSSKIVTRKERVALVSHEITAKWTKYWWQNMVNIIDTFEIPYNDTIKLTYSSYITKEIVDENFDTIKWDFDVLYLKHIIDDEFIKTHGLQIHVNKPSQNIYKDLTFDNMDSVLPDFESWHLSDVTAVMPLSEIDTHIDDYPWSWRILSYRRNMTLDFAAKWFPKKKVDFGPISTYINVSFEDIKRNEEYWLRNVEWELFVRNNKSVTREIIHEYFEYIVRDMKSRPFNADFIKHLTFEMYLYYIGQTSCIMDEESLKEYLPKNNFYKKLNYILYDNDYTFRLFQCNGDVNLSIIEKYPFIKWTIHSLSLNVSNTLELFNKYKKDISAIHIIRNAGNMSFEYLISNNQRIKLLFNVEEMYNPNELLLQNYSYEKETFEERKCVEHMAAYRIQQWWLRVTSDPRNPVCQRRLEREYDAEFPQN